MNLYEVMMDHFSQKGSQKGIHTYLVANSDEDVYEWLKLEVVFKDGRSYYSSFQDNEDDRYVYEIYDDKYNVIGTETYKEKITRLKGNMYDEDESYDDLYYGKTVIGWTLVKEGISEDEIKVIKSVGICIEEVSK